MKEEKEEKKKQTPKEKYDQLLKDIRLTKSEMNLEKIYQDLKENKSSLYDNNSIPFDFSNDLLWLLRNYKIQIDTQLDIFKLYVDEFFTMKCKPEDLSKTKFFEEIFKYDSKFYSECSNIENFLVFLNRFFNIYYPKYTIVTTHKEGDLMDVLVTENGTGFVLHGWIQLPIKSIKNNLLIFEDYKDKTKEIKISLDSFKVQEKNTFSSDEEIKWRNNLKVGDKIDYLNSKRYWVEATIFGIEENGDITILPLGDPAGIVNTRKKYSPFIQPLLKYSFKFEESETNNFAESTINNNYQPFNYCIPYGDKNYLIPVDDVKLYSLEYFEMLNYFISKLVTNNIFNEKLPIEYISIILSVFNTGTKFINQLFIGKYTKDIMYPCIKNILINISLDKKQNISKVMVDKILVNIEYYLFLSYYFFQTTKIMPEFYLNFGYNCFKISENLEKRLLGLNIISKLLSVLTGLAGIMEDEAYSKIISIINQVLLENPEGGNLFELLFNKADIHEQLLLKGTEIILILSKLKLLQDKDIERLYNYTLINQTDSDIYKSIHKILMDISDNIPFSQRKVLFDKIISIPYEKLNRDDINLMNDVVKKIESKDGFRALAKQFLDYFYIYMTEYKNKDSSFLSNFVVIISSAKDIDDKTFLYIYYWEKIIEDLLNEESIRGVYFFYDFLATLIVSIEKSFKNTMKYKLKEIFIKDNNSSLMISKLVTIAQNWLNSTERLHSVEYHLNKILERLKGILSFLDYENFFSIESLLLFCDIYVFSNKKSSYQKEFLDSIFYFQENKLIDVDKFLGGFFAKLDNYIQSISADQRDKMILVDENLIKSVLNFYQECNSEFNLFTDVKNENANENKKINPLDTKYFDVIWKIFLKFDYKTLMNEFLLPFSLQHFSPQERHEIWEKLIEKVFNDINDYNIIIALNMLRIIIKISEKYGTGGAVSHLAEISTKIPVKLKIINLLNEVCEDIEISENLYSTSTLYDVKKEIQKLQGIDPILVEFTPSLSNTVIQDPNGKLLSSVVRLAEFSADTTRKNILKLRRSEEYENINKYPLLKEDKSSLSDKAIGLLTEIFYKYSTQNKLSLEDFKRYFKDSTSVDIKYASKGNAALQTFTKFDEGNKGYLTNEEFIGFHYDSVYNGKENSIYTNFRNLGYRRDLEYFKSPLTKECNIYYEENNVCEYMPRFFIGNNREYMNKLFSFAKYDNKEVHELVQNILNEISTLSILKTKIFESNKFEEILCNKNLELCSYAYDILLTEFSKNDEEKKDIINNFINNNISKMIEELHKYNNPNNNQENDNKENKKDYQLTPNHMNFFLSNLKIIYYSFKKVIKNEEIIKNIDKFEDLEDENEKNVKINFKFDMDEQQFNTFKSFNLPKLINIFVNNIFLMEKEGANKREMSKFCYKIIIYIILISNKLSEEDQNQIYNDYIFIQLRLVKSKDFLIKRNIVLMNKLLLPLMEDNKKFILFEEEQLRKEILNYEKLNSYSGKLLYFFILYEDINDLAMKGIQKEILFAFMNQILDIILKEDIILNEYLLISYLGLIKRIISTLRGGDYCQKILEYDFEPLILKIINNFIITFDNNVIEEKKKNYSRYSDSEYINYLFELLSLITSINPVKYIKIIFENEDIKNVKEKHLSKLEDNKGYKYNPKSESKSIKVFVGLKNLSSLCYMNSVIQQLFMIPLFKNSILNLPLDPSMKEDGDNDDLLFQLQKMFHYLNTSDKEYYNPKSFVHSFKDYEGNPTNVNVQCDAQEFLTRFIEKIEEALKNTNEKFLCTNILGGTTLQQVVCTNPECGNISERRENINYLSLDIKSNTNIQDCLDKYIIEENIEDYHCEKCNKKITHKKSVLVDKLPNILIIHLQRIAFSYETFVMEKMNDFISFEKQLNIKKYTTQRFDSNIPKENYDYELRGVIIHSGTAQYGHYYSVIYSDEKDQFGQWYKFNDTSVTEVNYETITSDAFGSSSFTSKRDFGSSAYMLIYTKKIKKPVIVNVKETPQEIEKLINENKEKSIITIPEGKSFEIYENEKEAIEKNINTTENSVDIDQINNEKDIILKNKNLIAHLMPYDDAVKYINEQTKINNIKVPFDEKILVENIKFCNDKKIYSKAFTSFIYEITNQIKNSIFTDTTKNSIDNFMPIIKTINDFILNLLCVSSEKEQLCLIVDNLTDIYERSGKAELISYMIKDVIEPKRASLMEDYLLVRDTQLGTAMSVYIGKCLCLGINNSIENETAKKIIEEYIREIPVQITKSWNEMEFFNNLILVLVDNSDIIKKMFIQNKMISKLMDFIMGRESPLYQGDDRTENKNNKPKFGPIVKAIAILLKYYLENQTMFELSASDQKMIGCSKFYEKVILEDYDSNASNMLIEYRMKFLSMNILKNSPDKSNNNSSNTANSSDYDQEIIDILIKLKIPTVKKLNDVQTYLQLILSLFQKYSELYSISTSSTTTQEENNSHIFEEKMNILLGIPIPAVSSGDASIKYISGKYHDKETILTSFASIIKEANKESVPLLITFFSLVNINEKIFNYINNLPAPNSLRYSYIDYWISFYFETYKETEVYFSINDDMGKKNLLKELTNLIEEVCKKNNKDLNLIKENKPIKINRADFIYFNDFSFVTISNPKKEWDGKIKIIEMIMTYSQMQKLMKTTLDCFDSNKYFANKEKQELTNNDLKDNGLEEYKMKCLAICCLNDMDLIVDFKPFFSSRMEIKGKKEQHYFIYCRKYNEDDKEENKEEIIDYSKLNVSFVEQNVLALPPVDRYGHVSSDNACVVNCPLCGTTNVLDESNPELKCVFCEGSLF